MPPKEEEKGESKLPVESIFKLMDLMKVPMINFPMHSVYGSPYPNFGSPSSDADSELQSKRMKTALITRSSKEVTEKLYNILDAIQVESDIIDSNPKLDDDKQLYDVFRAVECIQENARTIIAMMDEFKEKRSRM